MGHTWASGGGPGEGFDLSSVQPDAITVQGYTAEEAAAAGIDTAEDPAWAEWWAREMGSPSAIRY